MFIKRGDLMILVEKLHVYGSWMRYVSAISIGAQLMVFVQWHVPVCALFKGRLVDQPETSMPETPETSGGEAEHEVYMGEGILLLVFELKLEFKREKDHVAQVLLELACESDGRLQTMCKD
jgi:hypothetical protein